MPTTTDLRTALFAVQRELDAWDALNSPSETGRLAADILAGHALHIAVVQLEQFYKGGKLPSPSRGTWTRLLRFAHKGDERAVDEAAALNEWIASEILVHDASLADLEVGGTPPPDDRRPKAKHKRRGRKMADEETVEREAKLVRDWERARVNGVWKVDFARDAKLKPRQFEMLLNRVRKREDRSDK